MHCTCEWVGRCRPGCTVPVSELVGVDLGACQGPSEGVGPGLPSLDWTLPFHQDSGFVATPADHPLA